MATCKQCKGLKERYPETGKSEADLLAEHFPNVIARTPPSTEKL